MGVKLEKAVLPMEFDTYVFDLYGTLIDIRTQEQQPLIWEKLSLFYGYYGAEYTGEELRTRYVALVKEMEGQLKKDLQQDPRYAHEASPEIEITQVFRCLFAEKGVDADACLAVHAGQFMRALSTEYLRCYPGTEEMLTQLKDAGKRVFLLSNAQRIFTAFEMNALKISEYFDDILISSDHRTKKPDERFFRVLLDRHTIDVQKTLFVGNDSRADIGGAKNVGMHTFYVNSNISPEGDAAPQADYIVEDFRRWEVH